MKFNTVFSLIFLCVSDAANILYLALLPSPSHHFWNSAIINELAKRDHNITIISPFDEAGPSPNIHFILLEGQSDIVAKPYIKASLHATESMSPFNEAILLQQSYHGFCTGAVKTNGFRTLLNYPNDFRFDLILNDFSVGSCFLPFLHKFHYPPMIAVTAFGHPTFLGDLIGGHHYYSYVPHMLLAFDDKMTFSQRLLNFFIHIEEYLLFKFYLTPRLDAIAAEHFGSNVPSVSELEQRTALALINTNPVMDYLVPLPENVIPVAGIHIKEPKPLSNDLKEFIDSSKKGVVLFSLGSNFRSDYMPQAKQKLFLDVFVDLPEYNFLWKFESNISSANLPKNVKIHPWLPVSDILADPKVKAIFFHGGLLTTQEALWRGIPMIIMPFALDQRHNLIKTKRLGIAEGVEYHSLNHNDIRQTILKILEDPSYSLNAHKSSAKFKDQKEKPLDRAIWWIEWLLRNPHSEYFKSPVFRLGFISANSYDVITFVILSFALLMIVSMKLFCFCGRRYFKFTKSNKNSRHKKVE